MLTKEQLEKLPTKRLLAYKRKWNKMSPTEYQEDLDWEVHMKLIKSILATREHVE